MFYGELNPESYHEFHTFKDSSPCCVN